MRVVGFDIDDTLLYPLTGDGIQDTINILKYYVKKGYTIVIITARSGNSLIQTITKQQLTNLGLYQYIDKIHYTSGMSKVKSLKQLNVEEFYDDLDYNIQDIIKNIQMNVLNKNLKLYKVVTSDTGVEFIKYN
jgi:hydroxymethylpyrimidine pyrophosphatase-like HAD family hydrolase